MADGGGDAPGAAMVAPEAPVGLNQAAVAERVKAGLVNEAPPAALTLWLARAPAS